MSKDYSEDGKKRNWFKAFFKNFRDVGDHAGGCAYIAPEPRAKTSKGQKNKPQTDTTENKDS